MKKSEFIQLIADYIQDRENEFSPEDQAKDIFEKIIDKHMIPRNVIKIDLFKTHDNGWEPENEK